MEFQFIRVNEIHFYIMRLKFMVEKKNDKVFYNEEGYALMNQLLNELSL